MTEIRVVRITRDRFVSFPSIEAFSNYLIDFLIEKDFELTGTREEAISKLSQNFDNILILLKQPFEIFVDPSDNVIEIRQGPGLLVAPANAGGEKVEPGPLDPGSP